MTWFIDHKQNNSSLAYQYFKPSHIVVDDEVSYGSLIHIVILLVLLVAR